jgi:hypothetical protein
VGKVLKIESASANLKGRYDYDGTSITLVDNYIYNSCPTLSLNDRILMTCYSSSSVIPATHLPIWLNAGTYTLKIQANQEIVQNSTSPTILAILPINFKGFISAIEFNIIP